MDPFEEEDTEDMNRRVTDSFISEHMRGLFPNESDQQNSVLGSDELIEESAYFFGSIESNPIEGLVIINEIEVVSELPSTSSAPQFIQVPDMRQIQPIERRPRGRPPISDPEEKTRRRREREKIAAKKYRQKKKNQKLAISRVAHNDDESHRNLVLSLSELLVRCGPLLNMMSANVCPLCTQPIADIQQIKERLERISETLDFQ